MAVTDLREVGTGGIFTSSTAYPTSSEIADAVWNKALPGAYSAGTAGNVLGSIAKTIVKFIIALGG